MRGLARGLWLPGPSERASLGGGEGPASCPSCRVLPAAQRCLPPTAAPADRQLVPLTRAGHQAHARCRAGPAGPEPRPPPAPGLAPTWPTGPVTVGAAAWGPSSLRALPRSWAKQGDICVSPNPSFWPVTAFLLGTRKRKGNPGPASLSLWQSGLWNRFSVDTEWNGEILKNK